MLTVNQTLISPAWDLDEIVSPSSHAYLIHIVYVSSFPYDHYWLAETVGCICKHTFHLFAGVQYMYINGR